MDNHIVRRIQIQMGQIYSIDGEEYRMFYVSDSVIGAIAMTHNEIVVFDTTLFLADVSVGIYQLVETPVTLFCPTISEPQRQRINKLKPIMDGLIQDTYPAWNLISKSGVTVTALAHAAEAAGMGKRHFRRRFYTYLRSGCDETSLIDRRANKCLKGALDTTTDTAPSQEIVSTKQLALEHALKVFKEKLNVHEAHLAMIEEFYSHSYTEVNEQGVLDVYIVADDNAPSYYTAYRYISSHLGGRTITEYIRGERENQNNYRMLTGTQQSGIVAIGQHMQVDECEIPVDLIDDNFNNIGKPVVYCAFESRAQIIIGLYIGLTNNSREGLTNLIISMLEPHNNQTEPYGVSCTDYDFPSCVIPRRVSSDRGSEYMANNMEQIMLALNLVQSPAPAGCGSYKGGVENVFKRFASRLKGLLINDGYITDTHDGPKKARKEACLKISSFRQVCYRLVLELNTTLLGHNYILDRELIDNGIPAVPSKIWQFEREKCFDPQMVTAENRARILFSLLWNDKKLSFDRAGFHYKQLRFIVDEPWLRKLIRDRKPTYEVRYNPNDISRVYVLCEGIIHCVPLAPAIDQYRSFIGLSWDSYDEIQKVSDETRKSQKKEDLDTSLTTRARNQQTLDQVRAEHVGINSDNEMREARALERAHLHADPNEPRFRLLEQEFPPQMQISDALTDTTTEAIASSNNFTNADLASLIVDIDE